MKIRPAYLVLLVILSATGRSVLAQDAEKSPALAAESATLEAETPSGEKSETPPPVSETSLEAAAKEAKIIEALKPADQERLRELLRDASTFVAGIRIQEAFEKLLEAEEIAPELFTIHNLKGAAYTKMRDFAKAKACFEKAISIAPEAFMGRFNLAETEFVTHQYPSAMERLNALIPLLDAQAKEADAAAADPKKPFTPAQRKNLELQAKATRGTIKLIEFKLLICKLKTGDEAGAQALQKTFNRFGDDPSFYYGHAAIAFSKGENSEGDEKAVRAAQEEAQEWLRSAENIYDRQQLEIYTDSLIESKWIDNLQ